MNHTSSHHAAERSVTVTIPQAHMNTSALPNGSKTFMSSDTVSDHVNEALEYLDEHTAPLGLTEADAMLVATGRLNWLLKAVGPSLSDTFTADEIRQLGTSLGAGPVSSADISNLPGVVLDDLGIEPDAYASTAVAPLIDKLQALNALERVALTDAIDRVCYCPQDEVLPLSEGFARLGITLLENS